jgi:hypothetical protein
VPGGSGDCSGWFPKIGDDPALRRRGERRDAIDLSPIFSGLAAQPAPKQTALNLVYRDLRTYKTQRGAEVAESKRRMINVDPFLSATLAFFAPLR